MKIAIAQLNFIVGDVHGNASKIEGAIREAEKQNADLLLTPELALLGYPPKDILLNGNVLRNQDIALKNLAKKCQKLAAVVGWARKNTGPGKPLFNAASVLYKGKILATHHKTLLPFYDVFDEGRYFEPGKKITSFIWKGKKIALTICEDIWNDKNYLEKRNYSHDPLIELKKIKPDLLVNISASPYWANKPKDREKMIAAIAKNYKVPTCYANLVGGNDELIFDGTSLVVNAQGKTMCQGADFKEDLIIFDFLNKQEITNNKSPAPEHEIYEALVLGTRDYVTKCGFKKVVLGLSGGIDSALVACIASDALGPKNVLGVSMPSRYSSDHSKEDAAVLAKNLGIEYKTISIEPVFEAYLKLFQEMFPGLPPNIAEENIQARIRGALLMAVSNKQGHLLLATGNKSEIAMGYCTLYGDLMGGLAPISDLSKGWVYKLSNYRNDLAPVIPERIFTKAPSAELKPNQTDQDTLPPYDLLDQILELYVVEGKSAPEIKRKLSGIPSPLRGEGKGEGDLVENVLRTVDLNEFKRRQAPPGLKVTKKAFGFGRRMPIAGKLKHE